MRIHFKRPNLIKVAPLAMVAAAGLLVAALPAWAHHAFAAEFDATRPLKLEGTVVKWELVNPHSWIHVAVMGPDG